MIIGICGKSGSGKSTLAKMFANKGAHIIDADKIGHDIIKKDNEAYSEIVDCFGTKILDEQEEIMRPILGQLVFSDEKARIELNRITHKYIKANIIASLSDFCVIDAALLFEAELDKICHYTIYVDTPRAVMLERITKRDNICALQAEKRLEAQNDAWRDKCDFIIDGQNMEKQFYGLYSNLLKRDGR